MTHDDLLSGIKQIERIAEGMWGTGALRAVVELHKPFMYDGRMGKYQRCSGCSSEEEWLGNIYPCPTIQAIEKELMWATKVQ
jgi:hypothetical protein